ncbi:MAG: rod shape-determining protein [Planctomycetota bacterium]|jgi:rod shape-determining protein MreB
MTQTVLHIGIDLGTFKTSVVSSNGRREVLPSAVGWPKDHFAQTTLGRDVVFGRDVFRQRLALRVVRPFEKGVLKYNRHEDVDVPESSVERHRLAARLLLEHAVSLTDPPQGSRRYGVIGAPSRASAMNKQVLIEAARDTLDAVFIVPEPFAAAYGMDRQNNTLVIDIGAGTVDICPMFGAYPPEEDQVTIPVGGDLIDEKFCDYLLAVYPEAELSINMAREIKERHGFVHDVNEKVLVTLPTDGEPRQFDVTEPLKDACKTIVPPIIQGLREVIAKLDPEFRRPMLGNILLSGGGSQLKGLDQLIESTLQHGGGKVTRVYDSVFAGAVGSLKLAMSIPQEYWSQIKRLDDSLKDAA